MIETILSTDQTRREAKLQRIARRSVAFDADLMSDVAGIVDDVKCRGDAALIEYTARFDGVQLRPSELRVDEKTLRDFAERVDPRVLEALREAIGNVRVFHERQ